MLTVPTSAAAPERHKETQSVCGFLGSSSWLFLFLFFFFACVVCVFVCWCSFVFVWLCFVCVCVGVCFSFYAAPRCDHFPLIRPICPSRLSFSLAFSFSCVFASPFALSPSSAFCSCSPLSALRLVVSSFRALARLFLLSLFSLSVIRSSSYDCYEVVMSFLFLWQSSRSYYEARSHIYEFFSSSMMTPQCNPC